MAGKQDANSKLSSASTFLEQEAPLMSREFEPDNDSFLHNDPQR